MVSPLHSSLLYAEWHGGRWHSTSLLYMHVHKPVIPNGNIFLSECKHLNAIAICACIHAIHVGAQ